MKSSNIAILQAALNAVNTFRTKVDQQAGIAIDSLSIRLEDGGMIVLTWREDLNDWDVAIQ
jgi:hypothetical protein